jgi:hypothetical protein
MTRNERLEQVRSDLRAKSNDSELIELAVTAYSRGYDEGFADGAVRGSAAASTAFEMAMGALAGGSRGNNS